MLLSFSLNDTQVPRPWPPGSYSEACGTCLFFILVKDQLKYLQYTAVRLACSINTMQHVYLCDRGVFLKFCYPLIINKWNHLYSIYQCVAYINPENLCSSLILTQCCPLNRSFIFHHEHEMYLWKPFSNETLEALCMLEQRTSNPTFGKACSSPSYLHYLICL